MRKFVVNVNGVDYNVTVSENGIQNICTNVASAEKQPVAEPAASPVVIAPKVAQPQPVVAPVNETSFSVTAPMPGKIVKVNATSGQSVSKGDVVIVLEAMKMQNEIKTPVDGVVKLVNVENGQTVKPGETMMTIG